MKQLDRLRLLVLERAERLVAEAEQRGTLRERIAVLVGVAQIVVLFDPLVPLPPSAERKRRA